MLQVVSELLVRLSRFHCFLLAMLSALCVLLGFAFVWYGVCMDLSEVPDMVGRGPFLAVSGLFMEF